MFTDTLKTPIGMVTIQASDTHILGVLYDWNEGEKRTNALTELCRQQLHAYFEGSLRSFDLPVQFRGTAFQKSVWQALLTIPYGKTSSYGDLASQLGSPKAMRAVGAANGRNKINVIVPCHRVIGGNGALTGYGGGMDRKRWLLDHEQKIEGNMLF